MKTRNSTVSRRRFLATTALGAATFAVPGPIPAADSAAVPVDLRKYEPNLRDRLWMWGHGSGSTDGLYNIPPGSKIDMADAVKSMGIPNVCVIRWLGLPAPPFDDFIKQFRDTKRVAWSIIDGAPQSFEQKRQWAFELTRKMPNLVGFYLDDYFNGNVVSEDVPGAAPAELSLARLRELRTETGSLERKTDLSVVLYSHQLVPGIKPHIDQCDVVSFWTWHATDLVALEANFQKYREIVPGKPTLLGIYMWDFGNSRPITAELMKLQLDFALKKFKEGRIEGMIFHCTPLCDRDLEAVNYSRKWIAEYADQTR